MTRFFFRLLGRERTSLLGLSAILAIGVGQEGTAQVLTFDRQVRTKMFINTIPLNMCDPVGAFAGMEGPFMGVANPIATANQILADGTWGFVASGHPSAFVEPAFQAMRIRLRTNIWHRAAGRMSCGVDGRGNPTSTMNFRLSATHFPSHRSYLYDATVNPPAFQRVAHNKTQGFFSNLWYLPAVGSP